MTNWLSASLPWINKGHRKARRAPKRGAFACETLEGRLVLDGGGFGGGILLGQLNYLGVVTGPVLAPPSNAPTSSNSNFAQLQKDEQALRTELNTLAAKSGVTVSDLTTLEQDSQALGKDWFGINPSTLQTDLSALVTAAADTSTTVAAAVGSTAGANFIGLLTAAGATTGQATAVATDVATVVKDSGVSPTDLTTVANDQAAIQTDLSKLSGEHGHEGMHDSFHFKGGGFGEDFGGGRINGSLSRLGVLTSPVLAPPTPTTTSSNPLVAKLQTDEQALQTELNTLSLASKVTVGDLTVLDTASQAAGRPVKGTTESTFQSDLSALVTAAAGTTPGTSLSGTAAYTTFVGLFSSSSAGTNLANAVVQVVQDSGITAAQLTTVATDQAAIQTDLTNLHGSHTHSGHRD